MEDIKWHTEEPEKKGTILVLDEDGYYDIRSWIEFGDLMHSAGWYDCMGEYPASQMVKWARIE